MESDDIPNETTLNNSNKKGTCPKHPTCPNPYPCELCNDNRKLACKDYSEHQNHPQLIGLVPKKCFYLL